MQAVECTLRQLIEANRQYVVPSFQRPYSWREDRWETFLEGIIDLFRTGNNQEIFLGAIVTMPLKAPMEGFEKFLLVDGQQRIITMLSLLAAVRDVCKKLCPEVSHSITIRYLTNAGAGGYYHYKLLPHPSNRQLFFHAMAPDEYRAEDVFPAVQFFTHELRYYRDEIHWERFQELLLDHFKTVLIGLEKDENPYPIFRSLNMTEAPAATGLTNYHQFADDPEIMALIASGESQDVEFKESVTGHGRDQREMERSGTTIVRAVAAFMNSFDGGTLLIGVADDGSVRGINREYERLDRGKRNWDGFCLYIRNMLRSRIEMDNPFRFYTVSRHVVMGRDICLISVKPSDAPAYINKCLYVRSGNQTLHMEGPDLINHVQLRWPDLMQLH